MYRVEHWDKFCIKETGGDEYRCHTKSYLHLLNIGKMNFEASAGTFQLWKLRYFEKYLQEIWSSFILIYLSRWTTRRLLLRSLSLRAFYSYVYAEVSAGWMLIYGFLLLPVSLLLLSMPMCLSSKTDLPRKSKIW